MDWSELAQGALGAVGQNKLAEIASKNPDLAPWLAVGAGIVDDQVGGDFWSNLIGNAYAFGDPMPPQLKGGAAADVASSAAPPPGAIAGLPGWAPWAIAGAGALILVAVVRR